MHARPASLVTLDMASISRAAAHTFHIFKMLVDDEFWPLRNIVKFAGEFRPIGTAKGLLHGGTPVFSSGRINCAEQGEARFPGRCKPPSDTSRRDSWERITLPDSSSRAKREDHSASSRAA